MLTAYKKFWTQYFDFKGRTNRSDYWWVVLINLLISLPITFFLVSYAASAFVPLLPYLSETGEFVGISEEVLASFFLSQFLTPEIIILSFLASLFTFVTFIPNLAILVRRLRDAGFHWAAVFLNFILLGSLILFVLTLMPSKEPK